MTTLSTARLTLRPFETSDIPAYTAIRAKPHVVQYLAAGPAAANDAAAIAAARVADFAAMWSDPPGYGPWAAIEKTSGRLIGHIGLRVFPEVGGETEVLYMLDDSAWGKGYATEGAFAARDFAFRQLALPRLVGLTHPDNLASQRVLAKIGMQRQPEPFVVHGIAAVYFTMGPKREDARDCQTLW